VSERVRARQHRQRGDRGGVEAGLLLAPTWQPSPQGWDPRDLRAILRPVSADVLVLAQEQARLLDHRYIGLSTSRWGW